MTSCETRILIAAIHQGRLLLIDNGDGTVGLSAHKCAEYPTSDEVMMLLSKEFPGNQFDMKEQETYRLMKPMYHDTDGQHQVEFVPCIIRDILTRPIPSKQGIWSENPEGFELSQVTRDVVVILRTCGYL